MKLLFITSAAPDMSPFSTHEKRPPLGVGSLMSLAQNLHHEVDLVDRYLDPQPIFFKLVDADIAGIYSNTVCFRDTLNIIKVLDAYRRRGAWNGKIVVGGPHASVAPATIPMEVDHIVLGEGEFPLLDIIKGHPSRIIKGPAWDDMDALPLQPWDIFTRYKYDWSCPWMEATPTFTLNTSRGCPYNCSFCSVSSVWGRNYRFMSGERVAWEVEHAMDYGAKGIYFREDNFTVDRRRVRDFCFSLKMLDLDVQWACEARVDNLRERDLEIMAAAGCRALYLGVESGSQRMLDLMNKKIDVEQTARVIRWGKKHGIRSYCSLIAGLPGERISDYVKTELLMLRLRPHAYSYQVFVGIPYSDLYIQAYKDKWYEYIDENGLLYPPGWDVKVKFYYRRSASEMVDHKFNARDAHDRAMQALAPLNRIWWMAKHGYRRLMA